MQVKELQPNDWFILKETTRVPEEFWGKMFKILEHTQYDKTHILSVSRMVYTISNDLEVESGNITEEKFPNRLENTNG
jgi:hypothetical protein